LVKRIKKLLIIPFSMVDKKGILHFIARFFIFIFIVAFIIAGSILMHEFGPSSKLYTDDNWASLTPYSAPHENISQYNVVLDQHSHTLFSDGVLTVKQNIEWHISMGFNAIVITDHNTVAHKTDIDNLKAEYLSKGVIIITGIEWTTGRIHMNFLGVSEWSLPIPSNPTDAEIEAAITEAHRQNAVATVDHIPWSLNVAGMTEHPTRDQLRSWGIDYIEVVNGDTYDNESNTYCDTYGIGKITGTDMHSPGTVHGWTLLNVTSFTEEQVMTALRNKQTTIVYNETGLADRGTYPDNPLYLIIKPISDFGGLFIPLWLGTGLDWVGVSVYLVYILAIFGLLEVYRYEKPKLKEKLQNRKNNKREKTPETSE